MSKNYAIKAIGHVRNNQHEIKRFQDNMLRNIKEGYEAKDPDLSDKQIKKQLESTSSRFVDLTTSFNKAIEGKKVPFEVKYNKNVQTYQGVSSLFADDEFVASLFKGKLPNDYSNELTPHELPVLGGEGYWGTSKTTYVNAALTLVYLELHDDAIGLPISIFYPSSSMEEPAQMRGYFHSGYAFGGERGESEWIKPYDCSSWIEKIYSLRSEHKGLTATTADFYAAYLSNNVGEIAVSFNGVQEWHKTDSGNLEKYFDVCSKQADPGDVYILRKFTNSYKEGDSFGCGGHAAIVIGHENGEYVTIGCNRDMPKMEGFGIERRCDATNVEEGVTGKVMLFSPTQSMYEEYNDIAYSGLSDLATIVDYFDGKIETGLTGAEVEDSFDS